MDAAKPRRASFNRDSSLGAKEGASDTATVVASAVPSRWARRTKLAGDSQRYNAHPFSDGGSVKRRPVVPRFSSLDFLLDHDDPFCSVGTATFRRIWC